MAPCHRPLNHSSDPTSDNVCLFSGIEVKLLGGLFREHCRQFFTEDPDSLLVSVAGAEITKRRKTLVPPTVGHQTPTTPLWNLTMARELGASANESQEKFRSCDRVACNTTLSSILALLRSLASSRRALLGNFPIAGLPLGTLARFSSLIE